MVPVFTLLLGMTPVQAAGISLTGVVAGSTMAAIDFLKTGRTDLKLALTLETITTFGALIGAIIAGMISSKIIYLLFAFVMLYSSFHMLLPKKTDDDTVYEGKPKHMTIGMFVSFIGGNISSLLGVGGGIIKVPVMNLIMNVPMKVATATSSYMVGITAATGAIVYFFNGTLDLEKSPPVMLGIMAGSRLGATLSYRIHTKLLKWIFVIFLVYTAIRMGMKGF